MRNITVAIDEETYDQIRAIARAQRTSVSALVKAHLLQPAERGIRNQITASDRISREALHDRTR
jgi:hypothetical protein